MGDLYRSGVSMVTAQPTESRFLEEGKLTADEFLHAGEQLCAKFPLWQWSRAQPGKEVSYLPQDQQYLITRGVLCQKRVRHLDNSLNHHTRTEDDWLLPGDDMEEGAGGEGGDGGIRDIDELAEAADGGAAAGGGFIIAEEDFIGSSLPADSKEAGGGLASFADLDADLREEDPSAAPMIIAEAPDDSAAQERRYDVSITYDKYYQTPRMWLFGYTSSGEPLKPEEVYDDVLSEYIKKTVTVDPHPCSGISTVSIHPCKHAQVMKKVVDGWVENGIEVRSDLALFVFLKFISGVVPTINYDHTIDMELMS